jgi:catechol 2,3-dioxygenase-like lactoylglutathione lyase family enzyme
MSPIPVKIRMRPIVLDCADAHALSDFYQKLLGWEKTDVQKDWVLMRDPAGAVGLSFQAEPGYQPPVWPEEPDRQQKMLHIDFLVDDLKAAQQHALACGARPAAEVFFSGVRTFYDPAGHPFCFFTDPQYRWE